jgi:hypothetical protein
MAPEQTRGSREVDHRADIYSLGVVIYELLTGELPLGKFAPPSSRVEVDVRIDQVVLRALEAEPARRYQRVSEVKSDVEAVAAGAGAPAPPEAPEAGRQLRPIFWLLACWNAVVLAIAWSLCRREMIWSYKPGAFLYHERTIRWDVLLPILGGSLALSAMAYWCVATWLAVAAYPGRDRGLSRSREGWALTLCLLGAVSALVLPWAQVSIEREPAWMSSGRGGSYGVGTELRNLWYTAASSEVGFVILALFVGVAVVLALTRAWPLLPRCSPSLVVLAGVAVVGLCALYAAVNYFAATVVSPGHGEFYLPWSYSNTWPAPGRRAHVTLTPLPLVTAALGLGLAACGTRGRRR